MRLVLKKASFYSHFKSKQEILDILIEEIMERYEAYSFDIKEAWNNKKQGYGKKVFDY